MSKSWHYQPVQHRGRGSLQPHWQPRSLAAPETRMPSAARAMTPNTARNAMAASGPLTHWHRVSGPGPTASVVVPAAKCGSSARAYNLAEPRTGPGPHTPSPVFRNRGPGPGRPRHRLQSVSPGRMPAPVAESESWRRPKSKPAPTQAGPLLRFAARSRLMGASCGSRAVLVVCQ